MSLDTEACPKRGYISAIFPPFLVDWLPHQCRWAGVVWAPWCRDLRDGLLAGVGCSEFIDPLCLVNSHFDHSRAWIPAYSRTAALLHLWRGICAAGLGYNEVLALEVRNVVWLRRTQKKCKASLVWDGSLHVRCQAVVPGVLACVHIYIFYVWAYICVCVYVGGHVYMYIYACACVFVHLCVYVRVYVYVYACLCIDCGSLYWCEPRCGTDTWRARKIHTV